MLEVHKSRKRTFCDPIESLETQMELHLIGRTRNNVGGNKNRRWVLTRTQRKFVSLARALMLALFWCTGKQEAI